MPKWKRDAKEFVVGVNYQKTRGYQSSIPKPIMDALGKPEQVKFVVDGDKIIMTSVHRDEGGMESQHE